MKTARIDFTFYFDVEGNNTMQCVATAEGITKDDAEAKAWQKMAVDNFTRNLILKTVKIEKTKVEFI